VSLEPLRKRRKLKPFEVFDIETTTDLKKVYLVGWHDGAVYTCWESVPLPPEHTDSAISQFLRWRFANPTRRPQYAHNGGNFDTVFALASIIALFPHLRVEIIPSQSAILLMKVTDTASNNVWEFRDSARTLPDSLDNLALCFLGERKMKIDDYSTLHLNPNRYAYLQRDCTLLFGVLSRYFTLLHDKLAGCAGISAASTALATYRTSYQRRPLPSISGHADTLARAGYYGGRCEPFRREFIGDSVHPLHCYDVNSMYPWAMRQPQPIKEVDIHGYHPELCGFIDCDVVVSDCRMPILPCRDRKRLLFPIGRWRGVFSTAELRAAIHFGQAKVVQFYGGVYFRTSDIFSEYVDTLYKFRDKKSPDWELSLDRIAKIALNSLYGKFGSQEVRETIHIRPDIADVFSKQMQQMPASISVDCYIERTAKHTDYMLPQISAWITALGRVKLAESLIDNDYHCYYCDTDSIYTDLPMLEGSSLGEWKDEYKADPIVYAYFLSPKVYVLKHASGKITNKAKGFSKFGKEPLPSNAVALLGAGESLEVSRFAKARSVIRGDFGLMIAQKRCHMDYEKRVFNEDGSSEPQRID
jgi:hypothetical protein